MKLSENAVYTTILPRKVLGASRAGAPSNEVSEKKAWVTALHRFQSARNKGQAFPVLFSDARRCRDLVFWATIVDMRLSAKGTSFSFSNLKGLRDCYTQDLVLTSTKRNIAPHYIRPYALVMTPPFLEDATVDAKMRFDEQESDWIEADWDRSEWVKRFALDGRDKNWDYHLDEEGDISRRPANRERGPLSEKVLLLRIHREPGFYYDLDMDDDGNPGVFRAPILHGEAQAAKCVTASAASKVARSCKLH
jgi:hypothetical protein